MNITRQLIFAGIISAMGISAVAQTYPSIKMQDKVSMIGLPDSIDAKSTTAYKALVNNIPQDPDFANAPRYAIISKDGNFVFSAGTSVKGLASYDWGNPYYISSTGLNPGDLFKADSGNSGLYQMTLTPSKLNFNFVGLPGNKHQFGIFVSFGFDGGSNNSYNVKCSKAYLRYRDFTFGYTSTLFSDQLADPLLIDGHGGSASGGHSTTTFKYEHYFNPHTRIGVAVEMPRATFTQYMGAHENQHKDEAEAAETTAQRIPDFPYYVEYRKDDNFHIRLTGMLRGLTYQNYIKGKNMTKLGYGFKITSTWRCNPITAFLMGGIGRGIASHFQDNNGRGLDLVPIVISPTEGTAQSGALTRTKSWGTIVGLQINFTKKVWMTGVFSHLQNWFGNYDTGLDTSREMTRGTWAWAQHLRYAQYEAANIMWDMNSLLRVGAEYVHGRRVEFGGTDICTNRVYLMIQAYF